MGLSSKKIKTTQTNKPIYSGQIEGAANNLNNTYQQQQPKIQQYADQIGGLTGGIIDQYNQGNPAVNAAQDYITSTLGNHGSNPELQNIIDMTGQDVAQGIDANLGTRGNLGGSVQAKILARELARNASNLRYTDYNNQQQRMAQAAGMAPGISAAGYIPLAAAQQTAGFGANLPLDAALKQAAGTGGLLGQYQTVKGTQKKSGGFLGDLLASTLGAAGSYFGA